MDTGSGSDRPRIAKLTGPNYRTWSAQVKRMLQSKRLWPAIEPPARTNAEPIAPAEEKEAAAKSKGGPTDEEPSAAQIRDWEASSHLMSLCSREALEYIVDMETAWEQWAKLKELYGPVGKQQLSEKLRAFNNYAVQKTGKTISERVTELNTLQAQIGAIDP